MIAVPLRLSGSGLEVGHRANTRFGTTLITGHPGPEESLDESARRVIHQWIGCDAQYVEQLYTLSTERDAKREVAVSYVALFRQDACHQPADDRMHWSAVTDIQIHDDTHRMVFDYALVRLKAKLGYTNIAFHLLPELFTLSELQQTYEHVLGHQVDKRNFRRTNGGIGHPDQIELPAARWQSSAGSPLSVCDPGRSSSLSHSVVGGGQPFTSPRRPAR